jgi:hypothetical protein
MSAGDGSFKIENLPVGAFTVVPFSVSGHTQSNSLCTLRASKQVTIEPNKNTDVGNMTLMVPKNDR